MKFQSDDILTKTFTRQVFGGYRAEEVSRFLQSLAEEVECQDRENQGLQDKLREKEASVREYRDREEMLKNTIMAAQKMADKIKQDAQKEARFIVESAEQKADVLVQDARDSLKTAYQDLSDLKKMHIQLKNTLKAVLQSHQDLLDQDPIHSILPASRGDKEKEELSFIEKKMNESLDQAARSKEYL